MLRVISLFHLIFSFCFGISFYYIIVFFVLYSSVIFIFYFFLIHSFLLSMLLVFFISLSDFFSFLILPFLLSTFFDSIPFRCYSYFILFLFLLVRAYLHLLLPFFFFWYSMSYNFKIVCSVQLKLNANLMKDITILYEQSFELSKSRTKFPYVMSPYICCNDLVYNIFSILTRIGMAAQLPLLSVIWYGIK